METNVKGEVHTQTQTHNTLYTHVTDRQTDGQTEGSQMLRNKLGCRMCKFAYGVTMDTAAAAAGYG